MSQLASFEMLRPANEVVFTPSNSQFGSKDGDPPLSTLLAMIELRRVRVALEMAMPPPSPAKLYAMVLLRIETLPAPAAIPPPFRGVTLPDTVVFTSVSSPAGRTKIPPPSPS